ncbi:MAG: hypothetical protein AAB360_02630 [Patescibacteria group bacterium]
MVRLNLVYKRENAQALLVLLSDGVNREAENATLNSGHDEDGDASVMTPDWIRRLVVGCQVCRDLAVAISQSDVSDQTRRQAFGLAREALVRAICALRNDAQKRRSLFRKKKLDTTAPTEAAEQCSTWLKQIQVIIS